MSKKGIVREKDQRITELESKLQDCERDKQTSVENAYASGQDQGWTAALAFVDQAIPILNSKDAINLLLGTMAGIVLKGQKLDKEMLDSFSQMMGGYLEKIDRDESAFREFCKRHEIYTPSETFADVSPAVEFREAFKEYYDGRDSAGIHVKKCAADIHFIYAESLSNIAPKHYVGRRQTPANQYISREGHRLAENLNIRLDTDGYILIGKRLFETLYRKRPALNGEEKAAYEKLSKHRVQEAQGMIWREQKLRDAVRNAMNGSNSGDNISTKHLLT